MKNYLFSLFAMLFSVCLYAQPTADFSVDVNAGCPILTVNFTDNSTGAVAYEWDLGDGNTSTVQNPTHIFIVSADYNVCLTVTDMNGLEDTYCETISVFASPTADAGPDGLLTCTVTEVTLDANGSSSGPNITYEWQNETGVIISTDLSTNVNQAGVYTLIVTDTNNGCTSSDEVIVLENTDVPDLDILTTPPCSWFVIMNNSVQDPNYQYVWEDDNGDFLSDNDSLFVTEAGTYTLILVDVTNGCSSSSSIEITNDDINQPAVSISASVQDLSCSGANDGAIDITVSNGQEPYFYAWSTGEIVEDLSGLMAGTYQVTVVDANDCIAFASIVVQQPTDLILDVFTECTSMGQQNGSLTAFVSGGVPPYLYEWSNGATTQNIINLSMGVYFLTVTDANGCTIEEPSILIGDANFTVEIPDGSPYCYGGGLQLCANIPVPQPGDTYSYFWIGPNGFTSTDQCMMLDTIGTFTEGTYSVFATNQDGCEAIASMDLDVVTPDEIISSVASSAFYVCEPGDEVQLEVLPGTGNSTYTYSWTPAASLSDPTIVNPIATIDETTTFIVLVTDVINGCTAQGQYTVLLDSDCVWPGDTDDNNIVDNFDLLNIGIAYDSTAPIRPNASINWVGQRNAGNWGPVTGTTVDRKHVDCNGDGVINSADTLAINQNWGLTHNFTGDNDTEYNNQYPPSGFVLTAPFYVEPDTLIENESYALPIILGEEGSEAEQVYGIAFSIEYDPDVILDGSASVGFDGWLGMVGDDVISVQKDFSSPGRIDIGVTRVDGESMDGFGQIGLFYITIEDDVLFRNGDDNAESSVSETTFEITNVLVVNSIGESIPVIPTETTTVVEGSTSTNDINWDEYIKVSPNPADQELFITTDNIKLELIELYTLTGVRIMTPTDTNLNEPIDISHLVPGVYILSIQTDLGVMNQKLIIK